LEPDFHPGRPGDVMRHCSDARFAREILDFHLTTDVRAGVLRTLEYFKKVSASPAELLPLIDTENWSTISDAARCEEPAS
jgi:hypothetical protein